MKLEEIIRKIRETVNVPRISILKVLSQIMKKDLMEINYNDYEYSEEIVKIIEKHFYDNYPIEYITNEVKFLDYDYFIDERVLIPRIETEDLVLIAEKIIIENKINNVLDIGTGSGVIAVSMKKKCQKINMYASDISEKALEVAKINALKNKVEIEFFLGNSLEPIIPIIDKIEMIVSNPPYVESNYISINPSLKYEPSEALFAGKDGQSFFENFIKFEKYIKNKIILFETTQFNILKTKNILNQIGKTEILKDSFGIERFIKLVV